MIKLQDFANQQGVTDRQIQRLIKKYQSELQGHFERKGANGTWLDEKACEILRGKMKTHAVATTDTKTLQELDELRARVKDLEGKVERKDVIIERLQQREQEKDQALDQLRKEQLQLVADTQQEKDDLKDKLADQTARADQLQRDLDAERNKSFFQRLFGK